MPSSAILDVAIGIAFVYLFLSLVCSVVNESIAAIFSLRSKNLVAGINSLLSGSKLGDGRHLVEALYAHGLIRGLYKDPAKMMDGPSTAKTPQQEQGEANPPQAGAAASLKNVGNIVLHMPVLQMVESWFHVELPAYIPSGVFATALIDVISPPDPQQPRQLEDVRTAIAKLPPSAAQQALMSLVADTQKDLPEFQKKVESWFNDSMERAAGWYRRRAQNILFGIALVLTVLLNVDTINLAKSLWSNPIARQTTVDLAQKYVDQNRGSLQNEQDLASQAKVLTNLQQQVPFPFGWQDKPPLRVTFWLQTLTGWLITTLALSLGAPFWFDTLNKFMVVRSTVKPQEKSKPEASKDAQ